MIACLSALLVGLLLGNGAPADRPLVHEAVIDAPIEEVWAAWATERGLESWLAKSAKVTMQQGGRYATNGFAAVGRPGTVEMKVIAFDPGHMLALTTSAPPDDFPEVAAATDTWAIISLYALEEAQTRVVYSMMGWRDGEEWDDARRFFEQANQYVLELLERRFAGEHERLGADRSTVRTLVNAIEVETTPAAVWDAITTRDGLTSWLGEISAVDLRLGGSITIGQGDNATIERIIAYDPGRVLVTTLDIPASLEGTMGAVEQTWIVTRIEPIESGKTRVVRTMLGWGSGPEWRAPRFFFETRLKQQMRDLGRTLMRQLVEQPVSTGDSMIVQGQAVLDFMSDALVGVWESEILDSDGVPTTIQNDIRPGPGDHGLVISGWFETNEKRGLHASTLVWFDHAARQTRFQSLDDSGSIASGQITLSGKSVVWDWNSTSPDGERSSYRMVMTMDRRWEYILDIFDEDDESILNARFTRARRLPTSGAAVDD